MYRKQSLLKFSSIYFNILPKSTRPQTWNIITPFQKNVKGKHFNIIRFYTAEITEQILPTMHDVHLIGKRKETIIGGGFLLYN
jgi:hypothetical protein